MRILHLCMGYARCGKSAAMVLTIRGAKTHFKIPVPGIALLFRAPLQSS